MNLFAKFAVLFGLGELRNLSSKTPGNATKGILYSSIQADDFPNISTHA